MSSKLGMEPAFPEIYTNRDGTQQGILGMNKRFFAACAAMQSMLSNPTFINSVCDLTMSTERHGTANEFLIKSAYELADELLKQENL